MQSKKTGQYITDHPEANTSLAQKQKKQKQNYQKYKKYLKDFQRK